VREGREREREKERAREGHAAGLVAVDAATFKL
jgi:hypothetical protein